MRKEYIGWLDDEWNTVLDYSQPIVRCCDCKRFKPREGATLNCRFEHPSMPNTIEWCYAEPDGFCAWGVKRENGQTGNETNMGETLY